MRNENDPRADWQKTKESICFRVLVKKSLPQINGRGVKGMAPSEPLGALIRYRTVYEPLCVHLLSENQTRSVLVRTINNMCETSHS